MTRLLYKFGRLLANIMIETEPVVKKVRVEEMAINGSGAGTTEVLDRPKRIKELKYAMLMSYDGSNYYGMQWLVVLTTYIYYKWKLVTNYLSVQSGHDRIADNRTLSASIDV
jgi:hypothetical protein